MTTRTFEDITADVEAVIEQTQGRMQCMIDARDTARCILEVDGIDPALLTDFGQALAVREIQNMLLAYWQRLVAAGKAQKHKDVAYRRRYDDAA